MSHNPHHPVTVQQYQDIVVPTDGSDGANYAAEHALALAESLDATVHAVSVVEDSWATQRDQMRTSPEEEAASAVGAIEERGIERDVAVDSTTLSGTPAQSILTYVDENNADLIVMSTHGRTGLKQVVFGSIAEDVVRNASVPVLTVRPPEWED